MGAGYSEGNGEGEYLCEEMTEWGSVRICVRMGMRLGMCV